jgi:type IV secretion system protein TrbL
MSRGPGLAEAADRGRNAAWNAGNSSTSSAAGTGPAGDSAMPAWASRLQAEQTARHRRQMAIHAISAGDRGGASVTPDIKERD